MLRAPRFRFAAAVALTGVSALGRPNAAAAQFPQWSTFPLPYVDARLVPPGQLQIGFLPSYAHYDTRFDSSGTVEPLGRYFSPDSAGTNFLPTLAQAEAAVRNITGDSAYRMNLGRIRLPLDADVRRFPFDFALGLTRRLTLKLRVPLVKTRVQGVLKVDSAGANVGWNLAAASANNAQAAAEMHTLLVGLQNATTALSTQIAQGGYGCPSSAQCADANALLARATQLFDDLTALAGPVAGSETLPPAAPLAASAAGQALNQLVDSVTSALVALGAASSLPATFPLPTAVLDSAGVQTIVTAGEFGYYPLPLATARRLYTLGDIEASLRLGLLTGRRLRAVLTGGVRLPTGTPPSRLHAFTLGTGDRQLDLTGGVELAWEPGRLALSGTAIYTRQLADQRAMRWATPQQPLAPAAFEYVTERKLGDVFQAAVYPALTLSEGIRVYASAYYYHKSRDAYSLPANVDPVPGTPSAAEVARGSGGQGLMLGGGIAYRAVASHRDSTTVPSLPVEAGLSYQAAFSGSGGLVPKSTMLNLYLRFYARLWGKKE